MIVNANSKTCNSNQKWSNKTCQCEFKTYHKCEKGFNCNHSTCICENIKYLKSVADTSVTMCDFSYFSYNCYRYCINKKGKYYSNKYYQHCFNKL